MENKQGNVETVSAQNNACQIDGVWYTLGPNVKISYVKKGPCEYSVEETEDGGNDLVVFVKSTGTSPSPSPSQGQSNPLTDKVQSSMQTMSALKSASRIYEGTGKEEEFKRLTAEILNFIEHGFWMENQ